MRSSIRTLALTAAIAVLPLAALAGAQNKPLKDRPFKATLATQEQLTPGSSRCDVVAGILGSSVGSGNASHLGSVTLTSSDCPAPLNAQLTQWFFQLGKLTLQAANGDMLYADYSGGLALDPDTGLFKLTGSYSITGGTGRFVGAGGEGALSGTAGLNPGNGTAQANYTATGTIRY